MRLLLSTYASDNYSEAHVAYVEITLNLAHTIVDRVQRFRELERTQPGLRDQRYWDLSVVLYEQSVLDCEEDCACTTDEVQCPHATLLSQLERA
jgi:hypothetical protein